MSYFKSLLPSFLPVLSLPILLGYENGKAVELNQVSLWIPFGLVSKLKAIWESSGGNARNFIYNDGFP